MSEIVRGTDQQSPDGKRARGVNDAHKVAHSLKFILSASILNDSSRLLFPGNSHRVSAIRGTALQSTYHDNMPRTVAMLYNRWSQIDVG